jgi:phosphohistidine swiveling domain-containing protein
MYPYYLTFSEERRDLDERRLWILDRMHFPKPVSPFDPLAAEGAIGPLDSPTLVAPAAPGVERRVLNGFVYVSGGSVADPAEIERRTQQLLPLVGHYLRRWDELRGEWAERVERATAELRDLEVPDLPEFEDEAVVMEGRGITSEHRLLVAFDRLSESADRASRYHQELVNFAHTVQLAFHELCRRHLPGTSEGAIVQMVAGGGEQPDRLAGERRESLPDDESRKAFDETLGLARAVFPYHEGHNSPIEDGYMPEWRAKVRDLGALLQRNHFFEEADDILCLQRQEAHEALLDLRISWADGGRPAGGRHWKPVVAARKAVLERFRSWAPPPALGPAPDVVSDPMTMMLWGVTRERLEGWLRREDFARSTLNGFAGAPGLAEGPARVLLADEDLGELREGEILVAPVAGPSWASAFRRADGAVSDMGGVMSGAASLAREHGIPAVVGTGFATATIRTGQKVRVDGDSGAVTLLDA